MVMYSNLLENWQLYIKIYRRTKNCKIVIFHQKLLKIVTNENGDKISLQNVECKFAYSFLDMGERAALSKSNFF